MRVLIVRLLCWISLLLLTQNLTAHPLLLNGADKSQWNLTLNRGKITLTGICIVKRTDDGLVGSVINEFGVHAFDMVARGRKLKLKNVTPMMNKWYIRKILQNDLRILTSTEEIEMGRKRDLQTLDNTIILKNKKYNISYQFDLIKQDDPIK